MNIVFLDAGTLGSDLDLSLFKQLGNFYRWENTEPRQLSERIADAHVIITNRISLGEKELRNAGNIRLIALTATGYNNLDTGYCRKKGIGVANVTAYSTDSVAQHTFAMLLYLQEQTRYYDDYIRQEKYLKDKRFADVSRPWNEIAGKKWGIIGMGAIGRKVASIASAFGAEVRYSSISGVSREEKWPEISLDELIAESDILSIHAPLNEKTGNLINRSRLERMKPGAVLLNLGRGAIVNEADLICCLKEGKIKAAGLDVLVQEPPVEGSELLPLIREGKLLVTPHNAWGSIESRKRLVQEVSENIRAFLQGIQRNRII